MRAMSRTDEKEMKSKKYGYATTGDQDQQLPATLARLHERRSTPDQANHATEPQKLTQNNTSKKPQVKTRKTSKTTKNQCKNVTTFLKHGFDGIPERVTVTSSWRSHSRVNTCRVNSDDRICGLVDTWLAALKTIHGRKTPWTSFSCCAGDTLA